MRLAQRRRLSMRTPSFVSTNSLDPKFHLAEFGAAF